MSRWPRTVLLPLAVTVAIGAIAADGDAPMQRYNEAEGDAESWFQCFVMMQVVGSAAWGLMPWLCWEPGNAAQPHVPGRLPSWR